MASICRAYGLLLERHPVVTQALTAGILMGSGDAIAQFCVEKRSRKTYEIKRTARFLLFGTIVAGPIWIKWYRMLDKMITHPPPLGVISKVAADQLLFTPAYLALFIGSMTYWSTGSLDNTYKKLKQDYKEVLVTNYKIWPVAQFVNFYFVPLTYRVIYVSVVALGWNTYLTYKTSQNVDQTVIFETLRGERKDRQ